MAFAAAAAKPTMAPLFADWLDQESASTAAIAADSSDEYEAAYPKIEHETVCLKVTEYLNCQACQTDSCGTIEKHIEHKVTCCNGIQTHGNYYYPDGDGDGGYGDDDGTVVAPAPPVPIGSCDVTFNPLTPILVHEGCTKVGTFSRTCNVAHGALCGAPFCDGLIFKQEGFVYNSTVISKTNPTRPTGEVDCLTTVGGIPRVAAMGYGSYGPPTPPSPPPPAGPCDGKKYFKNTADIWTGPVTIYSRKHHFTYHFGTMQYVDNWDSNVATCTDEAKVPLVTPYTYTIKMNKPQGHYYN